MRLIHLSDLHIGKRVNEVSMLEDQEYVLRQILQIIDTEKADVVLIAGDVYDKSIPPAEAVTLFDDFLCRLAKRDLPVFIISGNHDSPERLAFGDRLLEHSGIHISPVYNGTIEPVTLTDEHGAVHFWLLPFVKPTHVRRFYPDAGIESYTDAIRTAIQHMAQDKSARNVLLPHQFVTGAATCESEEVSVGGTATEDYLHIILTDEENVPEAVGRLRVIYPNLMKLTYDNTRTRTNQVLDKAEDVHLKSPLELFAELYAKQNNQPMSDEQCTFMQELIESIKEGVE